MGSRILVSNSFKKTPIISFTTKSSDKKDKLIARRRLRKAIKQTSLDDDAIIPHAKEVSDVWCFAKDGKQYVTAQEWVKKAKRK